jgi:hypothetical protein
MSRKLNWKRKYQRTYLRGFWCKFDRYAASHRAVREMKADGLLGRTIETSSPERT